MAQSHFVLASTTPATSPRPMRSTKACLLTVSFLLAATGRPVAFAEDWTGWRKDGSGVSKETNIPQSWGPRDNICWKTALPGEGLSSPIVWQDRIFLTAVAPGTITPAAPKLNPAP